MMDLETLANEELASQDTKEECPSHEYSEFLIPVNIMFISSQEKSNQVKIILYDCGNDLGNLQIELSHFKMEKEEAEFYLYSYKTEPFLQLEIEIKIEDEKVQDQDYLKANTGTTFPFLVILDPNVQSETIAKFLKYIIQVFDNPKCSPREKEKLTNFSIQLLSLIRNEEKFDFNLIYKMIIEGESIMYKKKFFTFEKCGIFWHLFMLGSISKKGTTINIQQDYTEFGQEAQNHFENISRYRLLSQVWARLLRGFREIINKTTNLNFILRLVNDEFRFIELKQVGFENYYKQIKAIATQNFQNNNSLIEQALTVSKNRPELITPTIAKIFVSSLKSKEIKIPIEDYIYMNRKRWCEHFHFKDIQELFDKKEIQSNFEKLWHIVAEKDLHELVNFCVQEDNIESICTSLKDNLYHIVGMKNEYKIEGFKKNFNEVFTKIYDFIKNDEDRLKFFSRFSNALYCIDSKYFEGMFFDILNTFKTRSTFKLKHKQDLEATFKGFQIHTDYKKFKDQYIIKELYAKKHPTIVFLVVVRQILIQLGCPEKHVTDDLIKKFIDKSQDMKDRDALYIVKNRIEFSIDLKKDVKLLSLLIRQLKTDVLKYVQEEDPIDPNFVLEVIKAIQTSGGIDFASTKGLVRFLKLLPGIYVQTNKNSISAKDNDFFNKMATTLSSFLKIEIDGDKINIGKLELNYSDFVTRIIWDSEIVDHLIKLIEICGTSMFSQELELTLEKLMLEGIEIIMKKNFDSISQKIDEFEIIFNKKLGGRFENVKKKYDEFDQDLDRRFKIIEQRYKFNKNFKKYAEEYNNHKKKVIENKCCELKYEGVFNENAIKPEFSPITNRNEFYLIFLDAQLDEFFQNKKTRSISKIIEETNDSINKFLLEFSTKKSLLQFINEDWDKKKPRFASDTFLSMVSENPKYMDEVYNALNLNQNDREVASNFMKFIENYNTVYLLDNFLTGIQSYGTNKIQDSAEEYKIFEHCKTSFNDKNEVNNCKLVTQLADILRMIEKYKNFKNELEFCAIYSQTSKDLEEILNSDKEKLKRATEALKDPSFQHQHGIRFTQHDISYIKKLQEYQIKVNSLCKDNPSFIFEMVKAAQEIVVKFLNFKEKLENYVQNKIALHNLIEDITSNLNTSWDQSKFYINLNLIICFKLNTAIYLKLKLICIFFCELQFYFVLKFFFQIKPIILFIFKQIKKLPNINLPTYALEQLRLSD